MFQEWNIGKKELVLCCFLTQFSLDNINAAFEPEKSPKPVPVFNLDLCSLRTFPVAVKAPVYTRGGPQIALFEYCLNGEACPKGLQPLILFAAFLLRHRTKWERDRSYALKAHQGKLNSYWKELNYYDCLFQMEAFIL